MKKTMIRIISATLFLAAFFVLTIYETVEFIDNIGFVPVERIVIIGFSCIFMYLGALLFGMSLEKLKAEKLMKMTFWIFFVIYVMLVVTFTLFDSYFGRSASNEMYSSSETFSTYLNNSVNLIPFKTIFEYVSGLFTHDKNIDVIITNLLGNICAFMPYALFLPLLFNKIYNCKRFILTMLCIVGTIELAQLLLLTGSLDVDDLILNVGGASLMYGILQKDKVKKLVNKLTLQN